MASTFMLAPRLLMLFDCTRGVDVGTKAEIFTLIDQLAARGRGVLLYSTDVEELVHRFAIACW